MARGTRKPASDSLTQQAADQRKPDLSDAKPPMVAGSDLLGPEGHAHYTAYFRTRSDWTLGDLALIVQASFAHENLTRVKAARKLGLGEQLALIDKISTQIRNCLRDASLRSKDGEQPAAVPASPGALN